MASSSSKKAEAVPLHGHACKECRGTGVTPPNKIKKTVSWHMSERYEDVEKGGEPGPVDWPLPGSEPILTGDNGVPKVDINGI